MYSKAEQITGDYYKKTEEHIRRTVKGVPQYHLSEKAVEFITQSAMRPSVLIGGRHFMYLRMTSLEKEGTFAEQTGSVTYVPFAILFGSADFKSPSDIQKLLEANWNQSGINYAQAKMARSYKEGNNLLGVVFAGSNLVQITEGQPEKEVEQRPEAKLLSKLPNKSTDLFPVELGSNLPGEQRIMFTRQMRETSLGFYGYASLLNERGMGISRTVVFHSAEDGTHSCLPAEGQETRVPIFNPERITIARPEDIEGYCVRNFPLANGYPGYPESQEQQLGGPIWFKNQLVYITPVGDFNSPTLTSVIAAAVS